MKLLYFTALVTVLLAGCVIHVGPGGYQNPGANPDSIFGDIQVSSGQEVQNIESVNGSIELSHRTTARDVETVNGNVELGDWVRVAQVVTVNGNIRAGENLKVDHKLETINGNIYVGDNAKIRGNVQSINGNMVLNSTKVEGVLFNMNGDVSIKGFSVIVGDVIYKQGDSQHRHSQHIAQHQNKPELRIAKDVIIEGKIILKRPVDLRFENPELKEKVVYDYQSKQK